MNITTSECSSGCESGWTMYLDQSSNTQESIYFHHKNHDFTLYNKKSTGNYLDGCDEEDEDLSMVSDASSGPPQYDEDDEYCFDENRSFFCYGSEKVDKKKKKNKSLVERSGKKELDLYLDDTASSPFKNEYMVLPPSGASVEHGTNYKGKSAFQKHIGFFQSSLSKKSGSGAAGGLQGRKWE